VAALVGAATSLIHAFLVITLRASQIVSGLALTIFAGAAGLSSYLGNDFNLGENPAKYTFHPVFPAKMQNWPIVGPIVFGHNVLVYASWALVVAVWLYLSRTRPGLNVRAVGDAPAAADAMGINVAAYRYAHVLVGGALAGVAGATFTPRDHASVGRRDHRRLRVDRDRPRHLASGGRSCASSARTFPRRAVSDLAPELQARGIQLGPTAL
jgi:ABC-type uncharacterized transport system permease subunit